MADWHWKIGIFMYLSSWNLDLDLTRLQWLDKWWFILGWSQNGSIRLTWESLYFPWTSWPYHVLIPWPCPAPADCMDLQPIQVRVWRAGRQSLNLWQTTSGWLPSCPINVLSFHHFGLIPNGFMIFFMVNTQPPWKSKGAQRNTASNTAVIQPHSLLARPPNVGSSGGSNQMSMKPALEFTTYRDRVIVVCWLYPRRIVTRNGDWTQQHGDTTFKRNMQFPSKWHQHSPDFTRQCLRTVVGSFHPLASDPRSEMRFANKKMLIQIVRYVLKTFMFISVVSNGGNPNRWIWIAAE